MIQLQGTLFNRKAVNFKQSQNTIKKIACLIDWDELWACLISPTVQLWSNMHKFTVWIHKCLHKAMITQTCKTTIRKGSLYISYTSKNTYANIFSSAVCKIYIYIDVKLTWHRSEWIDVNWAGWSWIFWMARVRIDKPRVCWK